MNITIKKETEVCLVLFWTPCPQVTFWQALRSVAMRYSRTFTAKGRLRLPPESSVSKASDRICSSVFSCVGYSQRTYWLARSEGYLGYWGNVSLATLNIANRFGLSRTNKRVRPMAHIVVSADQGKRAPFRNKSAGEREKINVESTCNTDAILGI